MLEIEIDGNAVNTNTVISRSMGFGEGSHKGKHPRKYCLRLDNLTIIEHVSDIYSKFVAIDKLDDEEVDEDYPELLALRNSGYPPLNQLIDKKPNLLGALIKIHFPVEFLSGLFPFTDSEIKDKIHIIDSINEVKISDDIFELYGDVFSN